MNNLLKPQHMDLDIFDYLNSSVWVKLQSTNYNVGVVAIRDIPINTKITDYDVPFNDLKSFSIDSNFFIKNIEKLHPSVRKLMNDRYAILNTGFFNFYPPNCHQIFRMYINHSDNPNVNRDLIAKRIIFEGEEVTMSYKELYNLNISDETKNYHAYVNNI